MTTLTVKRFEEMTGPLHLGCESGLVILPQDSGLNGIAQWGYLDPIAIQDEFPESRLRFRSAHVRQMHMRDAYALMQLIARKNRLPRWARIVLAVAALTHDVVTIAGGDSMKWCDPTLETFVSQEDALRREAELLAEGVPIVMLEDLSNYRIKPGVDFSVQTAHGLKTFEEVDPETASWLRSRSKLDEPIRIYYVHDARLTPLLNDALHRFYQRRKATTSIL